MTFFSTGHYVIRRCRQGARACVGPAETRLLLLLCVNVRLHEQEATGGLPIFSLNQWSRSGTVSEVLFFFS